MQMVGMRTILSHSTIFAQNKISQKWSKTNVIVARINLIFYNQTKLSFKKHRKIKTHC